MPTTHLCHSSVGVVEEDLEVLVEVAGVVGHLLLQQLHQAVQSYLTERMVGLL